MRDSKSLVPVCHFILTWRTIYTRIALHFVYFLPSTNSDYKTALVDLYNLVHFDCVPVSQWKEGAFWFAEWQSYQLNILSTLTGPHQRSQGEITLLPMYPMVSQHKVFLAPNSVFFPRVCHMLSSSLLHLSSVFWKSTCLFV